MTQQPDARIDLTSELARGRVSGRRHRSQPTGSPRRRPTTLLYRLAVRSTASARRCHGDFPRPGMRSTRLTIAGLHPGRCSRNTDKARTSGLIILLRMWDQDSRLAIRDAFARFAETVLSPAVRSCRSPDRKSPSANVVWHSTGDGAVVPPWAGFVAALTFDKDGALADLTYDQRPTLGVGRNMRSEPTMYGGFAELSRLRRHLVCSLGDDVVARRWLPNAEREKRRSEHRGVCRYALGTPDAWSDPRDAKPIV